MAFGWRCRSCKGPTPPMKGSADEKPWVGPCPSCDRNYDGERVSIPDEEGEDGVKLEFIQPTKDGEEISMSDAITNEMSADPKTQGMVTGSTGLDWVMGGALPIGICILLAAPQGGGKCLGRGTPVLMFDGTIKSVESVIVGDLLMGPDSKPRRVLATNTNFGPLYGVTPTKGTSWVCNDAHILTLVDSDSNSIFDMSLGTYLSFPAWQRARWLLVKPECITFIDRFGDQGRPVNPYFLGVWLGDGTKGLREISSGLALVSIQVTKPDVEIESICREVAVSYGLRVTVVINNGGCPSFRIVGEAGTPNLLLDQMRYLMWHGVCVPPAYLYGPIEVRLQVLAGLLDTDGYLHHNNYEIVQKSVAIANDVAFLARSLGLAVTRSIKTVNGEPYQRLFISGNTNKIPLRLARKKAEPRKQIKNALRTGFTLMPLGVGEYFGFQLDCDGRFLLGDFTITHNSTYLVELLRKIATRLLPQGEHTLYCSSEESTKQIGRRYARLGKFPHNFKLLHQTDFSEIVEHVESKRPRVAAIDSLHDLEGVVDSNGFVFSTGSGTAVTLAAKMLKKLADEQQCTIFAVAHVTKDGNIAGTNTVQHALDATLYLNGKQKMQDGRMVIVGPDRTLRCSGKNRFGETGRIAHLRMETDGIHDLGPWEHELPPWEVSIGAREAKR